MYKECTYQKAMYFAYEIGGYDGIMEGQYLFWWLKGYSYKDSEIQYEKLESIVNMMR